MKRHAALFCVWFVLGIAGCAGNVVSTPATPLLATAEDRIRFSGTWRGLVEAPGLPAREVVFRFMDDSATFLAGAAPAAPILWIRVTRVQRTPPVYRRKGRHAPVPHKIGYSLPRVERANAATRGWLGVIGDDELLKKIKALSEWQREWIVSQIDSCTHTIEVSALKDSDVATKEFLPRFGHILRAHHAQSAEPFTKDKFEYALANLMNKLGRKAELAPKGNRGHDLTIDGVRYSLKTQADKGMKVETLHISKFMELGKGKWEDEKDLAALRDEFLRHMKAYDRIFSLRGFRPGAFDGTNRWVYELVEIPKPLFELASTGRIVRRNDSSQNPKPGYCTVVDRTGTVLYQLYFDGGTERKLQIKSIRKDRCVVHATWGFAVEI